MFCSNCGKPMENGGVFCQYCGAKNEQTGSGEASYGAFSDFGPNDEKVREAVFNGTNEPKSPVENDLMYESYFDGGLAQLVCWYILGFFITICSFGLGLPWAFCMIYNWEIKHTVVCGRRLAFDGTGMGLFGNWIKWWLLTIITFGIYGLWVGIALKKWKVKHTYFAE